MPEIKPPDEKAQPLFRLIVQSIESGRIQEGDASTLLPSGESRLSSVASGWAGKFSLPEPDPADARMSHWWNIIGATGDEIDF